MERVEINGAVSGWQFDKKISITHMIATVSAITALIGFGYNLNTRLSLMEQAMTASAVNQRVTDERQDIQMAELRRQTREDYKAISDKLDRLIEREVRR